MNDFLEMLAGGEQSLFTPVDALVAMAVAVPLLLLISKTYQATHRGTSYSQSYLHTLFLMGLCTGIVMMIIGTNIARAFSLVGALSIIRFRTAVKDARDTGFLFFAMIVGMGCGTGFFVQTAVFTVAVCIIMWLLFSVDYGSKQDRDEILKVTYRRDSSAPEAIEAYLRRVFSKARVINTIRNFEADEDTLVYVVRSNDRLDHGRLTAELGDIPDVKQSAFYVNDQQLSV
jgi:uncharacterized membrane protein YhiD involved in acid resistance